MNNDDRSVLSIGAFGVAIIALIFAFYTLGSSSDDEPATVEPGTSAAATTVDISLTEFAMTPAMPTVPPGAVSLRVTNSGTAIHNLAFTEGSSATTRDLQPGESQTITLDSVEAGDLPFICTIPGHAESGMKGMLMVAAGAAGGGEAATGDTATPTTMSFQTMDDEMTARALRFVNEPKGTFGGTRLEPKVLADGTKEFDLTAEIVDWEVEPGKVVKAWTYNGIVPGPEIQVDVGDKVRVVLHNELPESTVIHFHGVRVPNSMDGVDPFTQDPVIPGDTFVYEFTALEPAVGMYHSHHNAQTQVPNGMAGAFLIGEMPIPDFLKEKGITKIDKSVNMVLNDAGTIGLSLNGKSFPATEAYGMKVGETMLVNYFNEGLTAHPLPIWRSGRSNWPVRRSAHRCRPTIRGRRTSAAPARRARFPSRACSASD